MKSVFLDSSVLFSAVNSPTGGSSKIFTLKDIKITTSKLVLTEVERNVRKKLHTFHLERFFILVKNLEIINQSPDLNLIEKAKQIIVSKDAVILAEAKKAKTDYLITLDRKHFLVPKVIDFLKPQKIVTPKMLHQLKFLA